MGWYGPNQGRGIGLARSNDLVHWSKFAGNPLWLNARWPALLRGVDPAHAERLYLAITRDYDTSASRLVLASSDDGIHLSELRNLVKPLANQRNQNPNLFHDPVSGRFLLTFYRGNDDNYFNIISKSAADLMDLPDAPEKLLLHSSETVAALNLWYRSKRGVGSDYGGITGFEEYQAPTTYIDASVSYNFNKHWPVFLDGSNLSGEKEKYYLVWPDMKLNTTEFETRYALGVRAKF